MRYIGIVGSRRRNSSADKTLVYQKFRELYTSSDRVVSGGCPQGADNFAEWIAKVEQVPILIYYAQWDKHGRSAGFVRNGDIAKDANILIACVAPDRTGGTEDTVVKFLKDCHMTEEQAIAAGRLFLV